MGYSTYYNAEEGIGIGKRGNGSSDHAHEARVCVLLISCAFTGERASYPLAVSALAEPPVTA
jgi:hypothetical protein